MENRETHNLTLGKKLVLTFAGVGIFVGPFLIGVAGMPKTSAVQAVSVLASPMPVYETASKAAAAVIAQAPARVAEQTPTPPAAQSANSQQWLEDVSIIISDEERRSFNRIREDERADFIMNFWLVRDPTPGTPANEFRDEYNSRVAYANQHFTTRSGIPGSRSDRGKMYILNGSPDEIVSHPIGGTFRGTGQGASTTTFPFETWTYRHIGGKGDNLTYEFVDRQMNGEYTLEYDPAAKVRGEGTVPPSNEQRNRAFRFSIGRTV